MNTFEKINAQIGYIVIGLLVIAYFVFNALVFEQGFFELVSDFKSIIHVVFVIFMNLLTSILSIDMGVEKGLGHVDFKKADATNKKNNNLYKQ